MAAATTTTAIPNISSFSSNSFLSHSPKASFFLRSSDLPKLCSSTRIDSLIRCQQKDAAALIPREQRWMFEESEINGPDIWNKTWYPKASDHITTEKTWYVVDATDKILGRLASTIAIHMRGKNLATYTPSVDMGGYVIVVLT